MGYLGQRLLLNIFFLLTIGERDSSQQDNSISALTYWVFWKNGWQFLVTIPAIWYISQYNSARCRHMTVVLTLILLTWRIRWAHNNARK